MFNILLNLSEDNKFKFEKKSIMHIFKMQKTHFIFLYFMNVYTFKWIWMTLNDSFQYKRLYTYMCVVKYHVIDLLQRFFIIMQLLIITAYIKHRISPSWNWNISILKTGEYQNCNTEFAIFPRHCFYSIWWKKNSMG